MSNTTHLSRLRKNADKFHLNEEENIVVTYDSEEELDLDEYVRNNTQEETSEEQVEIDDKLELQKNTVERRDERKMVEDEHFDNFIKPELLRIVRGLGYNELSKCQPSDGDDQARTIIDPSIFDSENCFNSLRALQRYLLDDASPNRRIWRQLASWKLVEHELLTILLLLRNTERFNEYSTELIDLMVIMTKLPQSADEEQVVDEDVDEDRASSNSLLGRTEKQRQKILQFQYKTQLPVLQQIKKAFLSKSVMVSLIDTVMHGYVQAASANDDSVNFVPEVLKAHEDYTISVMTLLVNLLKISDAKPNIASSSDVESNMQELFIKLLKDSHALELIIIIVQHLVEQRQNTSNTIFAKAKLLKWYLLSLEMITLLMKNETPTDLFTATSTNKVIYTVPSPSDSGRVPSPSDSGRSPLSTVNEQPRQIIINTSSDYSKKLLREAIIQEHRERVRSKAQLPMRHSHFGGNYVRHNDVGNAKKQQRRTMVVSCSQVVGGKVLLPTGDSSKRSDGKSKRFEKEDQENEVDEEEEKRKKREASAQPSQFVFHNIGLSREKSLPAVKQAFNRNRMPVKDELHRKTSTMETKKIVKTFATEFLKTCFNEFFRNIWEAICAQNESTHMRAAQGIKLNDERNFLLLGKFALEFNRCLHQQNERIRRHQQTRGRNEDIEDVEDSAERFDISHVSHVLRPEILDFVLNELIVRYPIKKQWNNLAYSVSFLKELILTLDLMFKSTKVDLCAIASRILHRILYDSKHCDSILRLVRLYRPQLNSRLYLADLFELVHVFLCVVQANDNLENFYTKKRESKRRKKAKNSTDIDDNVVEYDVDAEALKVLAKDVEGEKRFNLQNFKYKFSNAFVMKQYCYLLQFYATNSTQTNGNIIAMMKMVADECRSEPILYQLSLFKTINEILNDPILSLTEVVNRDMILFCRRLVRNFMDACNNDHKFMPAEVMFWKGGSFMDVWSGEDKIRASVEGEDYEERDDDAYIDPVESSEIRIQTRSTRTSGKRKRSSEEEVESEEETEQSQDKIDDIFLEEREMRATTLESINEEGEEEYIFDETQNQEEDKLDLIEETTPIRSRKNKSGKNRR